jgi:glycerol transport system ATP-binding protein
LKAVHRALDMLMIYVTHDQTEALTFADRVVVMNEGRAVQIGTPTELFERPEHTFVGYFIGSPGINLLPARVAGNRAHVGGHEVPLGRVYAPLADDGSVRIGVRPDYVTLASTGLRVQVRRVDDFGRSRLAHVLLAGHPVVATVPEGMATIGSEACVHFDPERVLVYQNDVRVPGAPE